MTDDVQVANRRLDASVNEALTGMARMGADAFGYKAELRIDRGLAQLLRLRVSQIDNCTYCLNLHYQAAREAGIPKIKIDTLTRGGRPSFTPSPSRRRSATPRRSPVPPHRPGRGVSALSRRARGALQPEEMLEIVAPALTGSLPRPPRRDVKDSLRRPRGQPGLRSRTRRALRAARSDARVRAGR
jgi:AhpD family alkylhydroperoxidase